jgi:hypothetical protein
MQRLPVGPAPLFPKRFTFGSEIKKLQNYQKLFLKYSKKNFLGFFLLIQ